MIYGINFNGTEIPPGVRRLFAMRRKVLCPRCKNAAQVCDLCGRTKANIARGYLWFELKGVAQSERERAAMLIQADNGHRHLYAHPRQTAAGTWYGIYVY